MNKILFSPQAEEFIGRTNRFIAAGEFLRQAETWIEGRYVELICELLELGGGLAAAVGQAERWRLQATSNYHNALRSLIFYEQNEEFWRLEEIERFIVQIKDTRLCL